MDNFFMSEGYIQLAKRKHWEQGETVGVKPVTIVTSH